MKIAERVWFKKVEQASRLLNVSQASRLPCSVPQVSHLFGPEEPGNNEQAGRSLYDPDKMPDGLREAHHNLDLAVDRIYRAKPFTSEEERLEHLFKLYEKMTAKDKLV